MQYLLRFFVAMSCLPFRLMPYHSNFIARRLAKKIAGKQINDKFVHIKGITLAGNGVLNASIKGVLLPTKPEPLKKVTILTDGWMSGSGFSYGLGLSFTTWGAKKDFIQFLHECNDDPIFFEERDAS